MVHKQRSAAVARKPHDGVHRVGVDPFVTRTLVKQRKRITHTALGKSRNERSGVFLKLEMLLRGDVKKVLCDNGGIEPLKAVALAAGENGRRDLVKLRRRKNKGQMLRRLLKYFEKCVEGGRGEHVHLVNDVHTLFDRNGRKYRLVPKLTHVVNAVV